MQCPISCNNCVVRRCDPALQRPTEIHIFFGGRSRCERRHHSTVDHDTNSTLFAEPPLYSMGRGVAEYFKSLNLQASCSRGAGCLAARCCCHLKCSASWPPRTIRPPSSSTCSDRLRTASARCWTSCTRPTVAALTPGCPTSASSRLA